MPSDRARLCTDGAVRQSSGGAELIHQHRVRDEAQREADERRVTHDVAAVGAAAVAWHSVAHGVEGRNPQDDQGENGRVLRDARSEG